MNDQYPILILYNVIHISYKKKKMKSGVACEQTITKQDGMAWKKNIEREKERRKIKRQYHISFSVWMIFDKEFYLIWLA